MIPRMVIFYIPRVISVFLMLAFIAFGIAQAFPINPVSISLLPIVNKMPFLSQDWNFFAPEPPRGDMALVVDCYDVNGKSTGDFNILDPIVNNHQKMILGHYDRTRRVIENSINRYVYSSKSVASIEFQRYCDKNEADQACKKIKESTERVVKNFEKTIFSISSAFCKDVEKSSRFSHMSIGIYHSAVTDWSRRWDNKDRTTTVVKTFDNIPIQEVKKFNIWSYE